ncbi:hypothetical protein CPL00229_CDS0177 [Escherichia phage vB_Eco_mar004NP2]|uniref:Uncharacterized protein n=1 Tax=Salmonella phage PMBT29 TaxID=3137286 RepID=A0AAU8BXB4_9VIRU
MCFQKMSPRNNRPPYNRPVLNRPRICNVGEKLP